MNEIEQLRAEFALLRSEILSRQPINRGSQKPYTQAEIDLLCSLYNSGMSQKVMVQLLPGRTPAAIRTKLTELRQLGKLVENPAQNNVQLSEALAKSRTRTYRGPVHIWTEDENETLKLCIISGYTIAQINKELGGGFRESQIRSQAYKICGPSEEFMAWSHKIQSY